MSESSNKLGGMARLQSISISPGMRAAVAAPNAAAPPDGLSAFAPLVGVVAAGASDVLKAEEEGGGIDEEEDGSGIDAG